MSERIGQQQNVDEVISQMLVDSDLGVAQSNIKPEYNVDIGLDSLVTKYNGLAYKIYGRGHNWGKKELGKKVEFYRQLTNIAKRLAEVKDYSFKISPLKSYPFRINIFDDLVFSERHKVLVGIVPFIEGPSFGSVNIAPDFLKSRYLAEISKKIQDELGIFGINIMTFNVKFNNNELVVTDLCGHIGRLHILGKRKFR